MFYLKVRTGPIRRRIIVLRMSVVENWRHIIKVKCEKHFMYILERKFISLVMEIGKMHPGVFPEMLVGQGKKIGPHMVFKMPEGAVTMRITYNGSNSIVRNVNFTGAMVYVTTY